MYVRHCTAMYHYGWPRSPLLARAPRGLSERQDLAHRPKDTGNVGNRYRAAKDLVILPFLVVIVVVKNRFKKKNSNNLCHNRRCSVKPKDQTSHALFRPPVLCIARRSICRDLTLGPTMTPPIFMWKFSATPESENWFTRNFTREKSL